MAVAGFDRSGYPGNEIMRTLRRTTNLKFCGYYLAPAPSHPDTSWMGTRSFVQDLGFGIAPIYVGEQVTGPGSHHSSSEKGTADGKDAVQKMESEGFVAGSCVYLDLEGGGPMPSAQRDYVNSWCNALANAGFLPGVYCSHLLAGQIRAMQPNARIWAVKVTTTQSHFVPGPHYPDGEPGLVSGFPGAFIVQLHENCQISVQGVAKALTVDLDSAVTEDPSSPTDAVGPTPTLVTGVTDSHTAALASEFGTLIPRSSLGTINAGIHSATEETMLSILGHVKPGVTTKCQDNLASDTVRRLLETRNFGNFRATGIKPALDSLQRIIDRVKAANPNLFNVVGSAGMLCVRLRKPTTGVPSDKLSNHSWGTAIDITIDGVADTKPDQLVQRGIAELIPFFNREGWFSGVGFSNAEDDTHFEVADETIHKWATDGFFNVVS